MKRTNGFTVVEIAVVIVILSILAVLTIITYNRVQANARNDSAKSKATVISEALEKYYEKNGQYPTCAQLSGAIATVTTTYLQGVDRNTMTRNGSATGTNSLKCDIDPNTADFTYSGNADLYTLRYMEESTGSIVSFTSRHKPPTATPSTPGISLAYNSSTNKAVATATASPCSSGSTLYSFRSQTNAATWTAYTTAAVGATAEITPTAGYRYTYQVRVQCSGNPTTAESPVSNSYIHPVAIVTNPSMSVSVSGDQTVANMSSVVCPSGTTAQNRIQWLETPVASNTTLGAWSSYSSTSISNGHFIEQGWRTTYRGQAFCDGQYADSSTVTTSLASAVRSINTPPTPAWNGVAYFDSGTYGSKPGLADFTWWCPPGSWRTSPSFDSYPQWDASQSWWHNFPYNDWWYTARSTTQYVDYYARYTCTTDFTSATSAEGYSRREVRP